MTHLWPDGVPLEVTAGADGTPLELCWRDRRHTVVRVVSRWRIDEHWWRARIWRDYWLVITDSDLLLECFRALPDGRWWLQRVID